MNKQRFAIIIIALIGMIATFLPWYRVGQLGVVAGTSALGWFTCLLFIVVIVLALLKNLREDMTMGISWSVTAISLLASFVVIWRMINVWFADEGILNLGGGLLGNQVRIGYGAWIVVLAGICIPLAVFLFRNRQFRRV